MYPRVTVDLPKLRRNLDALTTLCHSQGIAVAIVTKVFCADERIVKLIDDSAADMIADSRLENLRAASTCKPKLLLRIAMPSEAEAVVTDSDMSLQSEPATILALDAAARKLGVRHAVLLMVDMGDLREGLFFSERDAILDAARLTAGCSGLSLAGIGVNLTCYGGILPSRENLTALADIAQSIREGLGVELPIVSGGNSSTMAMLLEGSVPKGINHLRLGESFVLGNDTSTGTPVDFLCTDAFTLEAEIVELKRKPSVPIGKAGPNAFGEYVRFEDKGEQLRAICAIGRQDADAESLAALDDNISILGASSDHLIVDLTHAPGYNVGDVIRFRPGYGSLLRLFTSRYVKRAYINE
ncbi:MAG: alanine/ornithine racemase family PLP-dependent enzyme [Clostridia bacterium]|nr:alanine/ornithine racemase family PLP-dependent enzyme [Clostridia bacterium]